MTDEQMKQAYGHSYKHWQDGPEGAGWYAWSDEYPEEGYVWFDTETALLEALRESVSLPTLDNVAQALQQPDDSPL